MMAACTNTKPCWMDGSMNDATASVRLPHASFAGRPLPRNCTFSAGLEADWAGLSLSVAYGHIVHVHLCSARSARSRQRQQFRDTRGRASRAALLPSANPPDCTFCISAAGQGEPAMMPVRRLLRSKRRNLQGQGRAEQSRSQQQQQRRTPRRASAAGPHGAGGRCCPLLESWQSPAACHTCRRPVSLGVLQLGNKHCGHAIQRGAALALHRRQRGRGIKAVCAEGRAQAHCCGLRVKQRGHACLPAGRSPGASQPVAEATPDG